MFTRLARSAWLLPVLVMAAGSCRKTPPAPPPSAIPTAQPSTKTPIVIELLPEPAATHATPPPAEPASAPEPLALTQETRAAPGIALNKAAAGLPSGLTPVPGGFVRAWAVPAKDDEAKSDLFAVREDATGRAVGPTALLRRTSGKVLSILAAATEGQPGEPDVWISWMSAIAVKRGDGESNETSWLVAAVRTKPTLARVSRPITIVHQAGESVLSEDGSSSWLLGVAPSRGGLTVSCALGAEESRHGHRYVDYVSPDGQVRKLGELGPVGGDGGDADIIDLGSGVLAYSMAYVGGAAWDNKFFSYVPKFPAPKLSFIGCDRPPKNFHFNGQAVMTLCSAEYLADDLKPSSCPLRYKNDPESKTFYCPKLFVQRLDGTVLTPTAKGHDLAPVPITADRDVCAVGRWVRELAWKGGVVRLAPEPPPGSPPTSAPCKPGAIRRR